MKRIGRGLWIISTPAYPQWARSTERDRHGAAGSPDLHFPAVPPHPEAVQQNQIHSRTSSELLELFWLTWALYVSIWSSNSLSCSNKPSIVILRAPNFRVFRTFAKQYACANITTGLHATCRTYLYVRVRIRVYVHAHMHAPHVRVDQIQTSLNRFEFSFVSSIEEGELRFVCSSVALFFFFFLYLPKLLALSLSVFVNNFTAMLWFLVLPLVIFARVSSYNWAMAT